MRTHPSQFELCQGLYCLCIRFRPCLLCSVLLITGVLHAFAQAPPGSRIPCREVSSPVTALAIGPASERLMTGDVLGRVLIHDLTDGQQPRALRGHEGAVTAIALGAEKTTLFSGGEDGRVIMWETQDQRKVREFTLTKESYGVFGALALAVSSDERLLLTAEDYQASLWDVNKATRVRRFRTNSTITNVRFSSDRKLAFLGGGGFAVAWDVATGGTRWELRRRGVLYQPVEFLPTGQNVLMETFEEGQSDPIYGLWHGPSAKRLFALRYEEPVAQVATSADSKEIMTLLHTGKLARWDARNGRLLTIYEPEGTVPQLVAMSPDKKWIAVSSSEGVLLVDRVTGKVRKRIVVQTR